MQRRAVAVYVALFLLVASVAGVLVVTGESPEVAFDNPDHELSEGDSFTVEGDEYTLTAITVEEDDELGEIITGQIERERTAEQSETWANGSIVEVDDREWNVRIDDADSFALVEEQDFEALLAEDPNADNETVDRDGEEFVVVTDEDGDTRLVSPDEYFPAPEERSYDVGDELAYNDVTVTVDSVTSDEVTVVWMGPETLTIGVEQESMVTIGDTEFMAHFPDASTLTLSTDIDSYDAQIAQIEQFDQYGDGLWRVVIISVLSAMVLVGMAFMPSRY
ncbi:hypothetical protein J2751_001539 [Halorubrum alkaliphilum]|uniref:Uncharacterized protein n=1 Tax=Halorubrum alkaliphilum TaxID=261290 RepID=A0A8T4GFL6_9EURY|nr:hypothetical protein [Halorubrum alkaliphilum]MBP1922529.1 hypothetical protein [Halorubrum alkaliphilum]